MSTARLPAFLARLALALALLVAPAAATWSIVIVDLATGEVAVGIATCLTGFDLRPNTVVVVPGHGVAAAQSFVGPLSLRQLIRDGLLNGATANQILGQLALADPGHQGRQYGIVSLTGGEVTFTGSNAGAWAGGVVGQAGTLRYAIQGNVLTGAPVVDEAELAIVNTVGTLGDKLMAAMEAARGMGGDGRCSCGGSPTACGAPPANFTKSAHIGLMILSRPSDADAPCTGGLGCGAGDYWMDLNVANQQASDPDPVIQLQALYNTWKQNQVGRPDHFESVATLSSPTLRANGQDTVTCTVELRDAQGTPVGNSLPLTVDLAPNSTAPDVTFGPVVAQANGTYTFTMQGGFGSGAAVLDIAVTDAFGRVGLWPRPMVDVVDLFGPCGSGAIPDGMGGRLDALTIDGSAGSDRIVEVGYGNPFTLQLQPPGGVAPQLPVGLFALWLNGGLPPLGAELPLSPGNALCFTPSLIQPGAANLLLADSFGLGSLLPSGPAPWSLTIPGLPVVLDAALQGVMIVDPQGSLGATNAVYLRIVPLPAPTITSIAPPSPTPGQTVAIAGSDFDAGMACVIDGTLVNLTVNNASSAQFVMPAGVVCDAVLGVANPGGASDTVAINATPVITSLPISTGPAAGGTNVIIVGQNLLDCTATIGGNPISVTNQTTSLIFGQLPPGSPGPAALVVENPNGCQTSATFTYQ